MQHWHLDVTFKEDECRARMGFTSQNLSVLRKIALHIVSEQKDKLSMKRRLYKAALDINKNPLFSREKEVKNEQFSEETAQGNKSHLRSKNARCKPT